MQQISPNVFLYPDTCNVYVVKIESEAVLIEFGSGDVLDHLLSIGVERVTAVLMTHHHRDGAQGLSRAVAAGIPIYVPHYEHHLFADADLHWQTRNLDNNYNTRQDRYIVLSAVPVTDTLVDYTVRQFSGQSFQIVPTPGHTPGSISVLADIDGETLAFTGDLIAAPGQVWSLAATQWTYTGLEGVMSSMLSLHDLSQRNPDVLLPCHGVVMRNPQTAIHSLTQRLEELLKLRRAHPRMLPELIDHHEHPYRAITPHLLFHWLSLANTYVLVSESGKALMFDFGYDMFTGFPDGTDVGSRRPWAYSLRVLKRDFKVERIDVLMATHYHDDHVAGFNVVRQVEGAQVWAAAAFADILERPKHYDLPCLWYEPIPVDRQLPLETPIQWEEYTLTLHPLPGHTRYAVAISLEVDGIRVLIAGDQYHSLLGQGEYPDPNYVYANRFGSEDFIQSAALYRQLAPALILTGHWEPLWTNSDYLERLDTLGVATAQLHRDLLFDGAANDDVLVCILPYQQSVKPASICEYTIEVTNPFDCIAQAELRFVLPPGISIFHEFERIESTTLSLDAWTSRSLTVTLQIAEDFSARRARLSVDLTLNGRRCGQQAEALISANK